MTIGTLVHITANKKLMIKISEKTYDNIYNRLYNECKKKNFPTERLAVYSRENDDSNEHARCQDEYFAMVTPDKYDKQNMPKFERLLRKAISFSIRMKPYDFMNDDNEQVCGINLELISIRQVPKRIDWHEIDEIADKAADRAINPSKELNAEERAIDEDVEKHMASVLAQLPPKRETATRRRRTPDQLTEVEKQVKMLDDLIAAQEKL